MLASIIFAAILWIGAIVIAADGYGEQVGWQFGRAIREKGLRYAGYAVGISVVMSILYHHGLLSSGACWGVRDDDC